MGYSGAGGGGGGELIHEKNLKSKISWHCHFKKKKKPHLQHVLPVCLL